MVDFQERRKAVFWWKRSESEMMVTLWCTRVRFARFIFEYWLKMLFLRLEEVELSVVTKEVRGSDDAGRR